MINIHLKVAAEHSAALPDGPNHSLECRIARLNERFERIIQCAQKLGGKLVADAGGHAEHQNPRMERPSQWDAQPEDRGDVPAVRRACEQLGLRTVVFRWVPSDYYTRPLVWRRDVLDAPSIHHLCKSIMLENTHCTREDSTDPQNSRYYIVLFQYIEKFNNEKAMRFVRSLNEGIGKKNFNFRLADADFAAKVTGFSHNAMVPFGFSPAIPVILSSKILALNPQYFWMGGGHVDCKLRIDTKEYCEKLHPLVADVTDPRSEEELATIAD